MRGVAPADNGFLATVTDFIVRNHGEWINVPPYTFEQSEVGKHVTECGVKEIYDVKEEIVMEAERGLAGQLKPSQPQPYLIANFNCHCGHYAMIHLRSRGSINMIMYDIAQELKLKV